jgi:lipopolysaccharide export system protein LptA
MIRIFFLIIIAFTLFSVPAQAQKKIRIEDSGEGGGSTDKEGNRFRWLIDNVKLVQDNTRIYGDSVVLYPETNLAKVFGKTVRVEQGDSIVITGKELIYDGSIKKAEMRKDVVYRDPSMTLYTDFLDYNMPADLAYYYNGGRLVDSVNVLTSESGSYHTTTNLASFKDSVRVLNPDYRMEADTLQYNTATKFAYTKGPTKIIANDGTILNAEEGSEYNMSGGISNFNLGTIETEAYVISADELFSNEVEKLYSGTSNVEMISKANDVIITGDFAIHRRNEGTTHVYGHALMKKIMQNDTLYLAADTLVSVEDSIPANERILAYKDVKIYKSDLQGKSDSLAYHVLDSVIYFFQDPVLWAQGSQIEADSINVEIVNGRPRKMNTNINSFVISQDTLQQFNQVKGRKMTAFFDTQGQMEKIIVSGNGESLYYAMQGDSILIGMNKIICSDLLIRFKDNTVDNIDAYTKPMASFIPPHEISEDASKLADFNWRKEERPNKKQVLYQEDPVKLPQQNVPDSAAKNIKPQSKSRLRTP